MLYLQSALKLFIFKNLAHFKKSSEYSGFKDVFQYPFVFQWFENCAVFSVQAKALPIRHKQLNAMHQKYNAC